VLATHKPEMKWSAKLEAAAIAVAEDALSDVKIAEAAGVTKRTLENWKREPEFRDQVDAFTKAISEETRQYGIARRSRRIARLNGDYKALQQIILDRAAFYQSACQRTEARIKMLEAQSKEAEARSEALEPESKEAQAAKSAADALASESRREREGVCFHPGMDTGWLLVQHKQYGVDIVLDAGTEAALRAIEQQAARELGQWSEKSKVEHDFSRLSDAELIQRAKGLIPGTGEAGTDA